MDRMTATLAGLLCRVDVFAQAAGRKPPNGGFIAQFSPPALRSAQDDSLSQIAALADRLASGRQESAVGEPGALESVFCHIGEAPPRGQFWPLHSLELNDEALFPNKAPGNVRQAYATLWQKFAAGMEALQGETDPFVFLESAQALLRRYAWCIPAGDKNPAGVSLYDHSRVAAAIATCLADLDDKQVQRLLNGPPDRTPVARLVEGDISGVQRFIYTLTARGATRGLRGRSMYLQLLTEAAAHFLLWKLNLPITSLIYVGGGHFYLLAPAGEAVDKTIQQARYTLDDVLLTHHDGDLYLALGMTDLNAEDFQAGRFAEVWSRVGRSTGAEKRRRFAHLSREAKAAIFAPRGYGGNEVQECQVCHAEREDVKEDDKGGDAEPVRKCALCVSLEELGKQLGESAYLVLGKIPPQSVGRGSWSDTLSALGMTVGLVDERAEWTLKPHHVQNMERASLLGLNDFPNPQVADGLARRLGRPLARSVRYTVNVTPHRLGEKQAGLLSTFDDLCKASHGLHRFGVLRMDVDDLGYLFARGFRQNGASLARVASLSSALSLFFEGWVGVLCREANEQAQREKRTSEVIYAIYSGGDDLFIVGTWDVLPDLAHKISEDFRKFASENPEVHVSGGITLHHAKYPLYQGAQEARVALEAAKDYHENGQTKNAITFLGQSVPWRRWSEVAEWKDQLLKLVEKQNVGRSLLHVLGQLHISYMRTRDEQRESGNTHSRNGREQIVWGPYMWRGTYLLSRLAERSSEEAKKSGTNPTRRL